MIPFIQYLTADEGYEIEDVIVDGVSVGAAGTYTFENVKKAHTITVSFKKTVVKTANPFNDVTANNWFYENVLYVNAKDLMTGTSVNTFNPEGTMTRAMLVTVLYRLSGDTGSYTNTFSDVPSGVWYEKAVAWASANGISSGVGNNMFSPGGKVTREQLAVVLYNYAKFKGYDVSAGGDTNIKSYSDASDISDYAYAALRWACGAGILSDDRAFIDPQIHITILCCFPTGIRAKQEYMFNTIFLCNRRYFHFYFFYCIFLHGSMSPFTLICHLFYKLYHSPLKKIHLIWVLYPYTEDHRIMNHY